MRVITFAEMDMETLAWTHVEGHEYDGPVALAKGNAAKGAALTNTGTGQQLENTLFGENQQAQNTLLPFYTGELTNPQGYRQQTLNAMNTQAGQATSGSLSNATEQAKLAAARTGNPASQSAIIANAARNAAGAQSQAALDTQIQNAQLKQQQQQEGAKGIAGLGGEDLTAALNSLGLSNQAIGEWSNANKSAGNLWQNAFLPIIQGAEKGGTSINVNHG